MSNTPDTDANQIFLGINPDEGDYFVPATVARKLEQQRDEAVNNYETAVLREHRMQEQLDTLKESILDLSHPNMQLLLEERNEVCNQRDAAFERYNEAVKLYNAAVIGAKLIDKDLKKAKKDLKKAESERDKLAKGLKDLINYANSFKPFFNRYQKRQTADTKGGDHE
jgi:uncharacterized protein YydD (DUF2326 family)